LETFIFRLTLIANFANFSKVLLLWCWTKFY